MSKHYHDRQTMERLYQHLARADHELRDAQHFLARDSAEEAEMDLRDGSSPRSRGSQARRNDQPGEGEVPAGGTRGVNTQKPEAQEGAERSWWRRMFGG